MKLALATHSVVYIGTFGHAGQRRRPSPSNILLRSNSIQPFRICRPSGELVASWQVSPENGRIECRWSLEEPATDDHLCVGLGRTMRQPAIVGCHKSGSERVIIGAQAA